MLLQSCIHLYYVEELNWIELIEPVVGFIDTLQYELQTSVHSPLLYTSSKESCDLIGSTVSRGFNHAR